MFSPMRMMTSLWMIGLLASVALAGSVRYPAPGNVDIEEGTIEIWLTPTADLYPSMKPGGYQNVLSLVTWQIDGEFSLAARWIARGSDDGTACRLHVALSHRQDKTALRSVPGTSAGWQPHTPRHFAFTWAGREMRLYADGQLLKHITQTRGFTGQLAGSELIFGDLRNQDAGFILHAVRISRIARTADALHDAKAIADPATLLLDRFDQAPASGDTTQATVIAGLSGEVGGLLRGQWHHVAGPQSGLALYRQEK